MVQTAEQAEQAEQPTSDDPIVAKTQEEVLALERQYNERLAQIKETKKRMGISSKRYTLLNAAKDTLANHAGTVADAIQEQFGDKRILTGFSMRVRVTNEGGIVVESRNVKSYNPNASERKPMTDEQKQKMQEARNKNKAQKASTNGNKS